MSKFGPTKPTLRKRATGLLVFFAAAVVGLGILFGLGLWVEH